MFCLGRSPSSVVSGEAGIGKTALVERFLAQMGRQPSVRTLWAAYEALFTPRPLGPLYDIAQQTASPLRALPEQDGPWQMCADRLSRWRRHAILHP
jgi:predicted ATPase